MAVKRRQLGEILKRWGLVDDRQIGEALRISKGSRKKIGEVLNDLGYCTTNDVAKALASQFDMEFVDLDQPNVVDKKNLELIPADLIKKYQILPLGKENGRVKVLVHDPMDLSLIDDLRFRLGADIDMKIGARAKIKDYIDNILSETRASIDETVRQMTMDQSIDRGASMDFSIDKSIDRGQSIDAEGLTGNEAEDAQQTAIVRLVNEIIKEAVISRASDIHIEPFENRVRLRYRIDGVCHERDKIPKRTQGSVTARIKIMSGMKIEEKRAPQSGRIKMRIAGDPVDFRVEVCPAYHGESVVMRILRPESARIGLKNLGMNDDTLEIFNSVIRRPNGIFLVTGPTGSGKTTTLYSALDVLNRPDKKIITAEDPIEYNFKGINQCQVNDRVGLTFQRILKAMLRQAPNVILVGEIRDKEVGDVAIQAALTGHLVFSTLHTNDAPSAITRMIDMGIKPFLVASSVQAVLGQRLVRILCEHCKVPDDSPNPRLMKLVGLTPQDLEGRTIYKAAGCNRCGKTGYRGRRGIYEVMVMNSEIRELTFNRAPLTKIRQVALAGGMRNLLGDGRLKILIGQTTMDEISRITQVEGLVDVEDGGTTGPLAA